MCFGGLYKARDTGQFTPSVPPLGFGWQYIVPFTCLIFLFLTLVVSTLVSFS